MAKSTLKQLAGSQSKDENHIAISTASYFTTTDITATPITSPKTVSSVVIPLAVPLDATELVVFVSTANSLRVSELSDCSTYMLVPTVTLFYLPVAKMANVYLLRDTTDVTLQFMFKTLAKT